ncbi:MAG TPA: acylphosphatase, partial [Gemmatales bacterium]|nr:acylphosphatase [Gemmatales bacterium]
MRKTLAQRVQVIVRGTVQGVGFRPCVYRLAHELELTGWVRNSRNGVVIEVEGTAEAIETFLERLQGDAPAASSIEGINTSLVPARGDASFAIVTGTEPGERTLVIPPDLATCADCLRELAD